MRIEASATRVQTLSLVACTSRKGLYPAAAEFMYRSPLFSGARHYAECRTDRWFILSAKYGLLSPYDKIAPYNMALNAMSDAERLRWAQSVRQRLWEIAPNTSRVIFLAGAPYRRHLERLLAESGIATAAPLSSLGIGRQVAWLQRLARSKSRMAHIDRLYSLLSRLEAVQGAKYLREQSARAVHAARGVYFCGASDFSVGSW